MRGALKKQNSAFFSKFFSVANLFFSPRAPTLSKRKKNSTHLAHPSLFDAKFFYIFLNFLAIFFEFTAHSVHFKVFRLTRAAGMSKLCQNLHAPCSLEYLRSHKILDFFCYFLRIYCSPFTIHQTVKPL